MAYWILRSTGITISCTTIQRITNLEKQTEACQNRIKRYTEKIEKKWNVIPFKTIEAPHTLKLENEDEEFQEEFNRVISNEDVKDIEDASANEYGVVDPYLNMELAINRGDEEGLHHARVKRRAIDDHGEPVGRANNNPILDSRQYEIEYLDGQIELMTANIITENLLSQVDEEGYKYLMIDEIEGHRKTSEAITKSDGTYTTRSGQQRAKRTTKGWEIRVKWKGGSSDWIALKDLKDSYPVQLADYARANDRVDEPAFKWWVPYLSLIHI